MSKKINFEMFKPFGSTIAKAVLPLELLTDFLKDLEQIRSDKDKVKDYDFGKKLVGNVKNEFLITPEIMLKWKGNFFDPIIKTYTEHHYPNKKVTRIGINSALYVVSISGDYNPQHSHTMFGGNQKEPHLSCVGYLEIPKVIQNSMNHEKEHHRTNGHIEFNEGSENIFNNALHLIKPEVRNWYLFPINLRHSVYPFFSDNKKDERISFSFNAVVEFS